MTFNMDSKIEHGDSHYTYDLLLNIIARELEYNGLPENINLCRPASILAPKSGCETGTQMEAYWTPNKEDEFAKEIFGYQYLYLRGTELAPTELGWESFPERGGGFNGGQKDCAYLFSQLQNDTKATISAFIMAVLFEYLRGRSSKAGQYRDRNDFDLLDKVYGLSQDHVKDYNRYGSPWSHMHSQVLPFSINWEYVSIRDTHELALFLADQLRLLIHEYIIFTPISADKSYDGYDNIYRFKEKAQKDRNAKSAAEHQVWKQEHEAKRIKEEAIQQDKDKQQEIEFNAAFKEIKDTLPADYILPTILKNPAALKKRWGSLQRYELETLVWFMPMIVLGKLFDMSDNGVRKNAKRLGIKIPKQGFWLKVKTGTTPHPLGIPID